MKRFIFAVATAALTLPSLASAQQGAGERFEDMDANNDGRVSKQEYVDFQTQQARERFSLLDQNTDGYVTRQEAQAVADDVRQRWRERRQ